MASADEMLSAFRATEDAPHGEWWAEFPLGLSFEYGNVRWADAVVVMSRQPDSMMRSERTRWFRDRMNANWLEGERVAIIEVKAKGDADSWKALGQLQIYRTLFEMDWDATVEDLIILADESVPGEDSIRLLKDHIDDVELSVFDGGTFR